jgi:hypothetical protein
MLEHPPSPIRQAQGLGGQDAKDGEGNSSVPVSLSLVHSIAYQEVGLLIKQHLVSCDDTESFLLQLKTAIEDGRVREHVAREGRSGKRKLAIRRRSWP